MPGSCGGFRREPGFPPRRRKGLSCISAQLQGRKSARPPRGALGQNLSKSTLSVPMLVSLELWWQMTTLAWWLKTAELCPLAVWRPEVRDEGVGRSGPVHRLRPTICSLPASGGRRQSLASLGLWMCHSEIFLCPHMAFSLRLPSYKDPKSYWIRAPYFLQCNLIFTSSRCCNDSGSTYSHVLRFWGFGLQHRNFRRTQSTPQHCFLVITHYLISQSRLLMTSSQATREEGGLTGWLFCVSLGSPLLGEGPPSCP